jgi:hypothetical protein
VRQARSDACRPDILTTFKLVPELRTISSLIKPVVKPGSAPALVLVQNGIHIEREPHASLCEGDEPVCSALISCCAWLGATLVDGGRAVDHGGLERLVGAAEAISAVSGQQLSVAPDDRPVSLGRAWRGLAADTRVEEICRAVCCGRRRR